MVSEDDVFKIAALAQLEITPAEAKSYSKDLNSIFGYIKQLEKIDVSQVEAMTHVHGQTNVFREDEVKPSFTIEEVLLNAPDKNGRFLRVPIIKDTAEQS